MKLLEAVFEKDIRAVTQLVSQGYNLEEIDRDGRTPLINAAATGQHSIVHLLLNAGANINAQDKQGWSSLHFAAAKHDIESGSALLMRGANCLLTDQWGNTPLSNAVYYRTPNREQMIELLLKHGSDPNQVNNYGVSPRSLSESSPDLPVDWGRLMPQS